MGSQPKNRNALRRLMRLPDGTPHGFHRVGKSTGGRQVFVGKSMPTDKERVKLTREPTAKRAEEIHLISNEWRRAGLPIQVLERQQGRWTQQQYVKGHTVDGLSRRGKLTPKDWKSIIRQLGKITAQMYTLNPPAFRALDKSRNTTPLLVRRLLIRLPLLVESGWLNSFEAQRVASALVKRQPAEQSPVVTHGDFSLTNVVYSNGKVTLIDVDPRVELKDFDLARNLEKLQLTPALERLFFQSFIESGGIMPREKDLSYMRACAYIFRMDINRQRLRESAHTKYASAQAKRLRQAKRKLLDWV